MQTLTFQHAAAGRAAGTRTQAIEGVVASGNLEVLVERVLAETQCAVEIHTPVEGFDAVWAEVTADFAEAHPAGGLRFSINDMGARPDTVALRLAQALRLIAEPTP